MDGKSPVDYAANSQYHSAISGVESLPRRQYQYRNTYDMLSVPQPTKPNNKYKTNGKDRNSERRLGRPSLTHPLG